MRLIDAEEFQKFIEKQDESADYTIYHFEEWHEQQPTIEAKPVVHAHWEPKKIMARTPFARNFYCSNCKDEPLECKHICGNCGAQMDEKED